GKSTPILSFRKLGVCARQFVLKSSEHKRERFLHLSALSFPRAGVLGAFSPSSAALGFSHPLLGRGPNFLSGIMSKRRRCEGCMRGLLSTSTLRTRTRKHCTGIFGLNRCSPRTLSG